MSLHGTRDLQRRMRAIKVAFKPVGREWADGTVRLAKPQTPVITGKTRASIRVRNASMKKATVVGSFVARILDGGAKPHVIEAKKKPALVFRVGGNTIFAKKVHHRGVKSRGFVTKAAEESLRRVPLAKRLVEQWNRAA